MASFVAQSIPFFKSDVFTPLARYLRPFSIIALPSTEAVVVPSPTLALSLAIFFIRFAPIF